MVYGTPYVKRRVAENKELQAGLRPWRGRKGKDPKEGKDFHPGEKAAWRKSGEWRWTSRMRSRVAKKLDEQRRKLQKELRVIEKFLCVPKEFQENLKSKPATAATRGGAKEARPHARTPDSVEKISQKDTKHPGQKKKFTERQYRSRRGDAEAPRGAHARRRAYPFFCRTKSIKTRWRMQRWRQN